MTPPATKKDEGAETEATAEATVEALPKDQSDRLLDMVARMSPDQIAVLKTSLGIRDEAPADEPDAQGARPLSVTASALPLDAEATKAMTGAEAAKRLGVDVEDLLAFAVRAPLNVDGKPLAEKAIIVGSMSYGKKVAVEIGG